MREFPYVSVGFGGENAYFRDIKNFLQIFTAFGRVSFRGGLGVDYGYFCGGIAFGKSKDACADKTVAAVVTAAAENKDI